MKKLFSSISILVMIFSLIPLSLSAMEYQHELKLKKMKFFWTIEGDQIHVQLLAKTTGWISIGFDPEEKMKKANIIIGYFDAKKGELKIEDHYADKRTNHSSDKKLGGKDNILNKSGSEENGITTLSFTLPLNSGDEYDKPINPTGMSKIMLAFGAGKDSLRSRHRFRTIYEIDFTTGESKKLR
jgi:hypothetical protein